MKMNKKGFTLIEMLVVIAIIAVLVSIVIPVVGNSTEKAKEAADAANIRAAIAEVTTKALSGDTSATNKVDVVLTQKGKFEHNADLDKIGGYELTEFADESTVVGTTITISWDADNDKIVITKTAPKTE